MRLLLGLWGEGMVLEVLVVKVGVDDIINKASMYEMGKSARTKFYDSWP